MTTTIKSKNQLEGRIMRRIYFIWFGRTVLPYIIIEGLVFSVFIYLIGQYVFVAKVMQYASLVLANQSEYPITLTSFTLDIFLRTKLIVQISVLGSLTMFALVFKNLIASIIQLAHTKNETNFNIRVL
ncbi:MAG: hypothetical protein AAB648_01225 [Patescibacteria group bacterium]